MSPLTALRRALRALPGGIDRAAERADLARSTLYNKLNDECETHRLTFDEWRELAHPDFCRSTAPIQALCNEFGGVFVQTMPAGDVPAHALTEKLAVIAREFGEFLTAVSDSALDSVIDDAELTRIRQEFHELMAIGAQAVQRAEAMNRAYHERMAQLRADAEAAAKAARAEMAKLARK